MKKLILIAVLLVVVVGVVGVLILLNLEPLVREGVQRGGTMVLGVPVQLDSADVSILGGSVGLNGLSIGSPEGFDAEEMFRLGHGRTDVDLWSLRSDEIVVKEVVIDGAEVTLEFSGGKTNWGTLLAKLESEPTEEKEGPKKDFQVGKIVFKNGKVRLAGLPAVKQASLPLPAIELTDLKSSDGTGVSAHKLVTQVIRSLNVAALKTAGDVLPTEQLKNLGEGALGRIGEAGGLAGEAGSAVGKAAGEAKDKARGLIKGVLKRSDDE